MSKNKEDFWNKIKEDFNFWQDWLEGLQLITSNDISLFHALSLRQSPKPLMDVHHSD